MTSIPLPINALFRCVAADVDGDGRIDVVCPNYGSYPQSQLATVTLFGNGDGSFRSPVTRSFTTQYQLYPFSFAAQGDLNGDGRGDLVITDGNATYRLLVDGTGQFSAAVIPGGEGLATAADVNGDGKPDLLYSTGPSVALGNGDGTFRGSSLYGEYGDCLFQDVDGDHHPDAVCGDLPQGIGNSDGSFGTPLPLSVTQPTPSFVAPFSVADINHDGNPDVIGLPTNGLTVLLSHGPLAFRPAVVYAASTGLHGYSVTSLIVDMNGDGIPDFVEPGVKSVLINYGQKDGTFSTTASIQSGHTIAAATVADFNGDGISDVVTEGNTALQLSFLSGDALLLQTGNGDGTFSTPASLPTGGASFGATSVALLAHGDFNGDGKQDLLATSVTPAGTSTFPQTYLLLGHGDGSFDSPVVTLVYAVPNGTVLDLNQDGRADLLVSNLQEGNLQVWPANANGIFSQSPINSPIPQDSDVIAVERAFARMHTST